MVKASEPGYTMIPQYIIINSTSFRNSRRRLRPITPIDPSYFEGNMPRDNQSKKRRKLSETSRSDRSSSDEDDEEQVGSPGDDSSRAGKLTKSSSEESSANSSRDDRSNDGVSGGGSSESSSISMNNTVDKDSTSDFSGRYANIGARNVGSGFGMVFSSVFLFLGKLNIKKLLLGLTIMLIVFTSIDELLSLPVFERFDNFKNDLDGRLTLFWLNALDIFYHNAPWL